MKWILLIAFLALGYLPSLLGRIKRAGIGVADDESSEAEGNNYEENFFVLDGEESKVAAEEQMPYFSYETATEPEAVVEKKTVDVSPVEDTLIQNAQPVFDLRQAVIYQTVLNNRYANLDN